MGLWLNVIVGGIFMEVMVNKVMLMYKVLKVREFWG